MASETPAAEDVAAFYEDEGGEDDIEFVRLTVTPAQVREHSLPTAPAKRSDRRGNWRGGTVQAKALAPADLAAIVEAAIRRYYYVDVWQEVVQAEGRERVELVERVRRLGL